MGTGLGTPIGTHVGTAMGTLMRTAKECIHKNHKLKTKIITEKRL